MKIENNKPLKRLPIFGLNLIASFKRLASPDSKDSKTSSLQEVLCTSFSARTIPMMRSRRQRCCDKINYCSILMQVNGC